MGNKVFTALNRTFNRHQPEESHARAIKAGLGGALAIATLVLLGYVSDNALLMAPFGASCVLLFSLPRSPLSQPINVIAGHTVSVVIGLTLHSFLPVDWWSLALGVGLAITAMAVLRVTHPPAGADPIVIFFSSPGWEYILFPAIFGSIILIITAWAFHKIPPTTTYPLLINKNYK